MITDALLLLAGFLVDALTMAIDILPLPGPVESIGPLLSDIEFIFINMIGMSHWIPFDAAGAAIVFLYLAAALMFSIRIMRVVLSLLTGGGGSAG